MRSIATKLLTTLLILLIGSIQHSIFGQRTNAYFQRLSAKQGLSQNSVMVIFKDSQGYMWFGTRDGLNRYDGYTFTIYRHDGRDKYSLSNNYIRCIAEDNEGVIWVGTEDGLNAFDRSSETFNVYRNDPKDNSSISDNRITSILTAKNGDVWFGTQNGLNFKKSGSNVFQHYFKMVHDENSISSNHIQSIFQDEKLNLWIGTKFGGLNKLINGTDKIKRYQHDPLNHQSLGSDGVRSITMDEKKQLWIGTDDGIDILNTSQDVFTHLKHIKNEPNSLSNNLIRSMVFDNEGNLWIATYDGLNYYHVNEGTFECYFNAVEDEQSISHNSIRSLYIDELGILWAGTFYGGLNILRPNARQFEHFQHNPFVEGSISYDVVGALAEADQGNIWVGTQGGGLNYFNISTGKFTLVDNLYNQPIKGKTIKSLLIDSEQNLWIGTHLNGLQKIDHNTEQIHSFQVNQNSTNNPGDNSIISLLEDQTGKIWIGTNTGLYMLNQEFKLEQIEFPYSNVAITSIYQDSKQNIWIGTSKNGLVVFKNGTIAKYNSDLNKSGTISHNSIYEIYEDNKQQIWIGTYGGGLNLFDEETEKFKSYDVNDGLVNNIVYNIELDQEQNMWISTPSGISKFNPEKEAFKNYTPSNGLPLNEINAGSSLSHSNGKIFLGGIDGLMSFVPELVRDNQITSDIILTELKLFNEPVLPNDATQLLKKPINQTSEVIFNHDQNIFTIDFIALNYSQAGNNQYAYKLEGLESNWNYVGKQLSATYTNLSAGTYTFKVRTANSDGIWSDKIASLKIIKLPPYWRTNWAYLSYAILSLIFFLVVRRDFLIKLKLQNKIKLEQLEKHQLEDLTQLKLRYFTNISHDFRTPLTLIHAPLQQMINKITNHDTKSQLLLIKKNVNVLLRLVNQLMDFRKLESNKLSLQLTNEKIIPFIKEVSLSFKEYARLQNINYVFKSRVPNDKIWFDKDKVEKILYNILSNAFKHTNETGSVSVDIHKQEIAKKLYVEIRIRNSGPGIEKQDLDSIFDRFYQGSTQYEQSQQGSGIGLSLVKNLIELHKGYINVESELNEFTEFIIGIPLTDIYEDQEKINIQSSADYNSNYTSNPLNEKAEKVEPHVHNNVSVLVVEDNHDLRSFICKLFESEYNVLSAENGEVAYDIIKKDHVDIIISDIMMPMMSGTELCIKIKGDPKTNHIPVILLTARTSVSAELDGYGVGADDFISKPFNGEVLKSKVINLVKSRININKRARQEVLLTESDINNNSADEKFLEKFSEYIRDHIDDTELNVNKISEELGLSRVHLYRKIKNITGISPVEFIRNFRLSVAAKLLEQDDYNINEICYKTGFQDASYFRKCFKQKYGIPATKYAEQHGSLKINQGK